MIDKLPATALDWRQKGIPADCEEIAIDAIADAGWDVLGEDLMLPVAVLRESAIRHNSQWMRLFTQLSGARIAPHGKTTMSPQLFALQMEDGAWGVTAATVGHVRVYRKHGIGTILLANQLIGRQNIAYIASEMRSDPAFEFYCLVDSMASMELLEAGFDADPPGRKVQVLIELGMAGGRTGFRDDADALAVARRIAASSHLNLRGIEAFEGIVQGAEPEFRDSMVAALLDRIVALANACSDEGLFKGKPILSAGGSSLFDRVAEVFGRASAERSFDVILRSGCYLVHDSHFYKDLIDAMIQRSPVAASLGEGLRPALEIWAYVHSVPESTRLIAGLGKRDVGEDVARPTVIGWARPGPSAEMLPIPDGHVVVRLDDQHAYIDIPADSPLRPGDMVAFGISHPCTTFDKWQALYLVDDALKVTGAIRTFF
jgi:D-serine dehydratase